MIDEMEEVLGNLLKENQPQDYIRIIEEENDKLYERIQELTNNWNELRKHIKEYLEECENSDDEWLDGKCDMARDILYDMEEIKEGNK